MTTCTCATDGSAQRCRIHTQADFNASARPLTDELKSDIRAAISNAYYEARNAGRTMEHAADDAVEALTPILQGVDENAYRRGLHSERG